MSDIHEDGSEVLHYDNPEFTVFCRNNYIPAAYPLHKWTPIHWHEEVELIYVTDGIVHHKINKDFITLKKGDGLFINSRQLHELVTDENNSCKLYCLIFNPIILANCAHVERCIDALAKNEGLDYLMLREEVSEEFDVLKSVKTICDYWKEGNKELQQMAEIYLLWDKLMKLTQTEEKKKGAGDGTSQAIRDMLHYIQVHYKESITLDDICKVGCMGKTKATEIFKEYVHMTPIDYLRNFRIEMSLELLDKTNMSMTEIAYEVGFQGASYFGEVFKEKISMTPLNYRKLRKKEGRHD